jgi:hypothetical protein
MRCIRGKFVKTIAGENGSARALFQILYLFISFRITFCIVAPARKEMTTGILFIAIRETKEDRHYIEVREAVKGSLIYPAN